jgi:broad specificity phosphatase PhoE
MAQRVVRGHSDAPLSATGERQAAHLADWFLHTEPAVDRILSSDLQRCRGLAERISAGVGVPVETTERLREQRMGDWDGRTWEEITREDGARVTAYWDDYVGTRPPAGESFGDLLERIRALWSEILEESHGRRLVIVTHVGVIRTLLCHLLGIPATQALRFAPATASHTSLLIGRAGSVLTALGERPWSFPRAEAAR